MKTGFLFFLSFALFLCRDLALAGITETAPDFRVVIVPSQLDVCYRLAFSLEFRIENLTKTNQVLYTGSQEPQMHWHWRIDNPAVSLTAIPNATANFPIAIAIPPGGAYVDQIDALIWNPVFARTLTFRMGFTLDYTNTYWSNNIKLRIVPPDAWVRDGKYYRDRNHDGKIDWEVSGRTLKGDPIYPVTSKLIIDSNVAERIAEKWPGQLNFYKLDANYDWYYDLEYGEAITEEWPGLGLDIYKVDTNYDGYYDLEYCVSGTNGQIQIQWTKPIHERVPAVGKDFGPIQKEAWMDSWEEQK